MTRKDAIAKLNELTKEQVALFDHHSDNCRRNHNDYSNYYKANALYLPINKLRQKYNIPCYHKKIDFGFQSRWVFFPVENP